MSDRPYESCDHREPTLPSGSTCVGRRRWFAFVVSAASPRAWDTQSVIGQTSPRRATGDHGRRFRRVLTEGRLSGGQHSEQPSLPFGGSNQKNALDPREPADAGIFLRSGACWWEYSLGIRAYRQYVQTMGSLRGPHIGLLTPFTGGFYYGGILAGIHKAARARGAQVLAVQTGGLELLWPAEPGTRPLAIESVDGWIAASDYRAPDFAARITAAGIPLITLSQRPHGIESCVVLPDNREGARVSVQHLLAHGHRRIGFVGYLEQLDIRERYDGYCDALRQAGLEPDPALYFACANNLEFDGREAARRLIDTGLPCTAVVAGADKTALGIAAVLAEAGYVIPRDLALIGFDDIEKAQYAEPPLSTVRQRFDLLGTMAADVLLDHLVDGAPLPQEVRVPTAFVPRRSCGCGPLSPLAPMVSVTFEESSGMALLGHLLKAAEARHLTAVSREAWPGAERIVAHLQAVAAGESGLTDLTGVWAGFLDISRDVESIEAVVALLEEWVRRRVQDELDATRARALWTTVRHLRVELMRGWRLVEQQRSRYYDFVAEANGKINQALAGTGFGTAKDLEWLKWTRIRYGCLGLWDRGTETSSRQLRIIGEYGQEGTWGTLLDTCHAPEHFPPPVSRELIEHLGLDNVLILTPIQGTRQNRGLLLLAGPVEVELCDHHGSIGDWAALVATSLERADMERQLQENAFRDALTGLPNRALMLDRLEQVMSASKRESQSFAVLFLDLDDFKNINDSLGHMAGDQLIVQIANRLQESLRETHTLGRLGGDEFAVIIPNITGEAQVLEIVGGIQETLRPPCSLNGNSVFTSCSIGIAFSSDRHQHADELLREADTAMYRAKLEGRARHEIFDSGMHAQAVERLRLDSRLRQALERGEFVLHYQPVFSLITGRATGAEALIRWNHPEQGCLAPARFLAVAEEVGLAIPISEWVIETACRDAKTWQTPGEPVRFVNVNVPAQHLKDPGLVEAVRSTLQRHSLAAEALGLELVESTLIEHQKSTIRTLQSLRQLGVRTAIDDFGTGYSSLSYLKRFPVNVLKIDRSFVYGVPGDVYDSAIAGAIIAMAHDLKLTVVAEGVETREQVQFLRSHQCDAVQGFLLSRPLPAKECRDVLQSPLRSAMLLERTG